MQNAAGKRQPQRIKNSSGISPQQNNRSGLFWNEKVLYKVAEGGKHKEHRKNRGKSSLPFRQVLQRAHAAQDKGSAEAYRKKKGDEDGKNSLVAHKTSHANSVQRKFDKLQMPGGGIYYRAMSKARLNTTILTLFLLSAAIFVFNTVPSSPAIDDTDPQISAPSASGHRTLPLLAVVPILAALALFNKRAWGAVSKQTIAHIPEALLVIRIARGPPHAAAFAII